MWGEAAGCEEGGTCWGWDTWGLGEGGYVWGALVGWGGVRVGVCVCGGGVCVRGVTRGKCVCVCGGGGGVTRGGGGGGGDGEYEWGESYVWSGGLLGGYVRGGVLGGGTRGW